MMRSGFILPSIFLMVLVAVLASISTAHAQCAACGQEGDWSTSATAFLEGQPINETPPLWGPKAVRLTNSQFETAKETAKNADNTSAAAKSSAETPTLDLVLENASATPGSVSPGSPVMITAAFKESGSNLADNQTTPSETAAYNVSAVIKDSAGTEVGKLNLQPSSGDRYAGIWNGSMACRSLQGDPGGVGISCLQDLR